MAQNDLYLIALARPVMKPALRVGTLFDFLNHLVNSVVQNPSRDARSQEIANYEDLFIIPLKTVRYRSKNLLSPRAWVTSRDMDSLGNVAMNIRVA